jgi:hypothetical protein
MHTSLTNVIDSLQRGAGLTVRGAGLTGQVCKLLEAAELPEETLAAVVDLIEQAEAKKARFNSEDSVQIDGCRVPGPLYRAVKLAAKVSREMRYIAVFGDYHKGRCAFEVFEKRDDIPLTCTLILWISPRS